MEVTAVSIPLLSGMGGDRLARCVCNGGAANPILHFAPAAELAATEENRFGEAECRPLVPARQRFWVDAEIFGNNPIGREAFVGSIVDSGHRVLRVIQERPIYFTQNLICEF